MLEKREMEYTMQHGKGSFIVNACSGHELTAPPALCKSTKVVVQPNTDASDVMLVNRPRINTILGRSDSSNVTAAAPKPSEVAADDELVARVKHESQHEHRQQLREEHVQLKQALTVSKQELEWQLEQGAREEEEERIAEVLRQSKLPVDEEQLQRQDEERLEEILRHSREEEERIKREEEETLAEILRKSQEEEERIKREEDEKLAEILRMSQEESQLQASAHDEEALLNQALQQSLHEVHATDADLNKALSMSLNERRVLSEDEVLLNKALRLSITELPSCAEMLEEQVGYVIEEVD